MSPWSDSDGASSSGGMGGDSGGGAALGGESGGGTPTGGSHSGGTGATGGSNGTGGTGTGGEPGKPELPMERHYWKLDETSGGTAQDSGYMSFQATVVQGTDWSSKSGVKLGAFEVKDGPANYVQMPNTVMPESDGTFSLSWWVAPTSFGNRYLVSKQGSFTEGGFFIMQTGTGMRIVLGGSGVDRQFDVNVPLPQDGRWTHLVMTYRENLEGTPDRLRLFVNGEQEFVHVQNISSGNERPNNRTQILRFGGVEGNALPPYTGLLDEIRIYEAELTEQEVVTLHGFDLGELQVEDIVFYDPRVLR